MIYSLGVALWLTVLLPSQLVYLVCHHWLRGYNQWVECLYDKVQSQQNQQFYGGLISKVLKWALQVLDVSSVLVVRAPFSFCM